MRLAVAVGDGDEGSEVVVGGGIWRKCGFGNVGMGGVGRVCIMYVPH